MASSEDALPVLHGLRLRGRAASETVASLLNISSPEVVELLTEFEVVGLASRRPQPDGTYLWALTAAGQERHQELLATELDSAPERRSALFADYRAFVPLNRRLLALLTRWQVRTGPDGVDAVNRHDDPDYDAVVLTALDRLHDEATPLLDRLVAVLPRLELHHSRLTAARERIADGDHAWIADALIDSYHTVWFELHEDLLLTLGLDRATETALAEDAAASSPSES